MIVAYCARGALARNASKQARARDVAGHFVNQAEVQLRCHQVGIECHGAFKVRAGGGRILTLDRDQPQAVVCRRGLSIRQGPTETAVGVGQFACSR